MKCAKCGKKIEYNRYKKVKGKYYCPECVPKEDEYEAFDKAIDEASDALIEPPKAAVKIAKEFGVNFDELASAVSTAIKPRKKYKKRKIGTGVRE